MTTVLFKRLHARAVIPTQGSPLSAGYDLYSCYSYAIEPGERCVVSTGISWAGPENLYARVAPRSSLALKGIDVLAGVVDPDYRGEISVVLQNNGAEAVTLKQGDRVAQIIFTPYVTPEIIVAEDLPETERAAGGFGSTGA